MVHEADVGQEAEGDDESYEYVSVYSNQSEIDDQMRRVELINAMIQAKKDAAAEEQRKIERQLLAEQSPVQDYDEGENVSVQDEVSLNTSKMRFPSMGSPEVQLPFPIKTHSSIVVGAGLLE